MSSGQRGREVWYKKLFRILNSAVCFSIAYIALTQLFWLSMAAVSKFFKFDVFVYYYGIKFILNDKYWNRLNISLIYTAGTLTVLLLGLFSIYLYFQLRRTSSIINTLLVWGFVVGTSMFSAQAFIASLGANEYNSPYYQNLAVVFAWLRIPVPLVYLLNIPFAVALVYFSVNANKPFLSLAFSYTKVNKLSRRRKYYIETAVIPFLLGAVGTTVLTFPMNIFIHMVYLSAIAVSLFIGWFAMAYIDIIRDEVIKVKSLQTLNPVLIFLLALLIIAIVVTWRGLYLSFG